MDFGGGLLEKIEYEEEIAYDEFMAMQKCMEYDLYSPSYTYSNRNGCFFFQHAKALEHLAVYQSMPKVWEQFVALEEEECLAFSRWCPYGPTLQERNMQVHHLANLQT